MRERGVAIASFIPQGVVCSPQSPFLLSSIFPLSHPYLLVPTLFSLFLPGRRFLQMGESFWGQHEKKRGGGRGGGRANASAQKIKQKKRKRDNKNRKQVNPPSRNDVKIFCGGGEKCGEKGHGYFIRPGRRIRKGCLREVPFSPFSARVLSLALKWLMGKTGERLMGCERSISGDSSLSSFPSRRMINCSSLSLSLSPLHPPPLLLASH